MEELRQCGRYETLGDQLAGYLRAKTINELYERVLGRLEADGNDSNVRSLMRALWSSRAGLSEVELLSITGLKPLEWAPIDLALEEALSRNGNRLVFGHEYLRKAVQDRYLSTETEQRQAHSQLADWFEGHDEWDARKAEELPCQLIRAGKQKRLKDLVMTLSTLSKIVKHRGSQEARSILAAVEAIPEFDEKGIVAISIREILSCRDGVNNELLEILGNVSLLISECGLFGELLKVILNTLLENTNTKEAGGPKAWAQFMIQLVECQRSLGEYSDAIMSQKKLIAHLRRLNQDDSTTWLNAMHQLALTYQSAGDNVEAIKTIEFVVHHCAKILGGEHPSAISAKNDLALFLSIEGRLEEAESIYEETIVLQHLLLGPEDYSALIGLNSYACLAASQGNMQKSLELFTKARDGMERLKGPKHPDTMTLLNNTAVAHSVLGKTSDAIKLHERCLTLRREIYGPWHVDTLDSVNALGKSYCKIGAIQKAGALILSLQESLKDAPSEKKQDVQSIIEVLQKALEAAAAEQ